MSKPAYPKYKPSPLDWLGDVPEHWDVQKLKFIANVQNSNVDKKSNDTEQVVHLCNYVDVYHNDYITSAIDFMVATATSDEIRRFTLERGEVLITKDSETWDDIAVPAFVDDDLDRVLCGYHLAQVRPAAGKADGEYLFRAFTSHAIRDQFRVRANGITRFGLSRDGITSAVFPMPPIAEQRAIAKFLRCETARIDRLVAKKERLIELLAEKRTALIVSSLRRNENRAVRLKRLLSFTTSGSRGWSEFYADDGDLFIQSGNLNRRLGLDLRDVQHIVAPDGAEAERTQIRRGDVLVCITGAYTGNVSVVDSDMPRAFINQHIALLRPDQDKAVPRFLAYYLASPIGQGHFIASQYGGTKQGLGFEDIHSIRVVLPSLERQNEIVLHLDTVVSKLDRTEQLARDGISRLQEYRSALISAAVTGKIDVRGWTAREGYR